MDSQTDPSTPQLCGWLALRDRLALREGRTMPLPPP